MRSLPREESRKLKVGSEHYTAYVGPPALYDFLGAAQFRLLITLGLREQHHVLDLGCGSLRAGRMLIPYLLPDRYCGVDPNLWLIDDGVAEELGQDILTVKRPRFDGNADFRGDMFGTRFDFVLAQSVFSHATPGLVRQALANIRDVLAPTGLLACTFRVADDVDAWERPEGWVYPGSVTYSVPDVEALLADAGLTGRRIPWFHPRQTWFLAALDPAELPSEAETALLTGVVLRDHELRASLDHVVD